VQGLHCAANMSKHRSEMQCKVYKQPNNRLL